MKKICAISECNFPQGECRNLCWHPDDARMDIIGQNGPTGEHYQASDPVSIPAVSASYVRLVAMNNGRLLMDYHASWDGSVDVLRRARALIDMLIAEAGKT